MKVMDHASCESVVAALVKRFTKRRDVHSSVTVMDYEDAYNIRVYRGYGMDLTVARESFSPWRHRCDTDAMVRELSVIVERLVRVIDPLPPWTPPRHPFPRFRIATRSTKRHQPISRTTGQPSAPSQPITRTP